MGQNSLFTTSEMIVAAMLPQKISQKKSTM